MNKKKIARALSFLVSVTLLFTCASSFAEDDVQDLKKQIELLQKRVEELESSNTQQDTDDSWGFFNRRSNRGWDPFEEMGRMQEEMDRMFQNSFSFMGDPKQGVFSSNVSFDHKFDIQETEEGYEVRFDMTGLDQEKVSIDINEHSISVKGEHSAEDTEEKENAYFSSKSYGSFMKTIPLPVDADTSKVKTEKEGNSLVVKLPKKKP